MTEIIDINGDLLVAISAARIAGAADALEDKPRDSDPYPKGSVESHNYGSAWCRAMYWKQLKEQAAQEGT